MSENIKTGAIPQGQADPSALKFGPLLEHEHISRVIHLPFIYNQDRIVAMVRDPWWIFVYWEITQQTEQGLKDKITVNGENFEKSVLRIYDITDKNLEQAGANSYFDISLQNMARNWYVEVGHPGRDWCVEIGMFTREGNFYPLARSNKVATPRFGMSDILDEAWMISEEKYWWLFGVSGGFDVGKSSMEMKELFVTRLQEWVSSGGVFGLSSHNFQQKK